MSPDPHVVTAFIAGILALATIVFILPVPCKCKECQFHERLRLAREEVQRIKRHKEWHKYWNVPWGAERCVSCKMGNRSDERVQ